MCAHDVVRCESGFRFSLYFSAGEIVAKNKEPEEGKAGPGDEEEGEREEPFRSVWRRPQKVHEVEAGLC